MKLKLSFLFFLVTVIALAQKEYTFGSTGQQKLLINPSLAGNSNGLNVQTLFGSNNLFPFVASYAGVDYGTKKLSYALSNNYFGYKNGLYTGTQTDLSTNYKIKLNDKITLVPSLQVSYLERRIDRTKLSFSDLASLGVGYNPFIINEWSNEAVPMQTKKNVSFSSGLLLDINRTITFGVSVYDFNQPDQGILGAQKRALSQVYHISGILFSEKKVQLQPYSILKMQREGNRYYEVGAYTSYKNFSIHTGFRNDISYNYKNISTVSSQIVYLLLGANITYKKIKLGYTYMSMDGYGNAHELFVSANLFNKDKKQQRNLMLN